MLFHPATQCIEESKPLIGLPFAHLHPLMLLRLIGTPCQMIAVTGEDGIGDRLPFRSQQEGKHPLQIDRPEIPRRDRMSDETRLDMYRQHVDPRMQLLQLFDPAVHAPALRSRENLVLDQDRMIAFIGLQEHHQIDPVVHRSWNGPGILRHFSIMCAVKVRDEGPARAVKQRIGGGMFRIGPGAQPAEKGILATVGPGMIEKVRAGGRHGLFRFSWNGKMVFPSFGRTKLRP